MKVIHEAQFELSVDGVFRSYRNRREREASEVQES
jgi:hypothetical protein